MVENTQAALLHSRAAIIASGTATVQAAVLGTPFVAVYRVSNLTFRLAKRLVRYPAEIAAQTDAAGNLPIAMPNLIAGRRVVPELLQDRFTAEISRANCGNCWQTGPSALLSSPVLPRFAGRCSIPVKALRWTVCVTLYCRPCGLRPASSGTSASASNV